MGILQIFHKLLDSYTHSLRNDPNEADIALTRRLVNAARRQRRHEAAQLTTEERRQEELLEQIYTEAPAALVRLRAKKYRKATAAAHSEQDYQKRKIKACWLLGYFKGEEWVRAEPLYYYDCYFLLGDGRFIYSRQPNYWSVSRKVIGYGLTDLQGLSTIKLKTILANMRKLGI